MVGQDEFCTAFDPNETVNIANLPYVLFVVPLVAFFLENIAPNFVHLNVLDNDIGDLFQHEAITAFPH